MPDDTYDWAWGLGQAVCVTAVRGVDERDLLSRFGGAATQAAEPVQQDAEAVAEAEVRLVQRGEWTLGIEVNGWQGSRTEVLRLASTGTTAISAF